jgi:hypothetical protein
MNLRSGVTWMRTRWEHERSISRCSMPLLLIVHERDHDVTETIEKAQRDTRRIGSSIYHAIKVEKEVRHEPPIDRLARSVIPQDAFDC